MEDRYYKLKEWRALTQDQRDEVSRIREARKKRKKAGNGNDTSSTIAVLQANLEAKDQMIAALTAAQALTPPISGKVPALVPPPGYAGGKKKKPGE